MLRHVATISPKFNMFVCKLLTILLEFRIDRIEFWILFEQAVTLCNLLYSDAITGHSECASFRSEYVKLL